MKTPSIPKFVAIISVGILGLLLVLHWEEGHRAPVTTDAKQLTAINKPAAPGSSLPALPSSDLRRLDKVGQAGLAPAVNHVSAGTKPSPLNPTEAEMERAHSLITVKAQQSVLPQRAPPPAAAGPHTPPSMPPAGKLAGTARDLRLAELQKELAEEKDPRQAQRTMLTIASFQVGSGDWDAAKETYEQLKSSPDPEVLDAVGRNLDVVQRNRTILAEPDAERREWLRLDLAAVHQNYGHEKAAKKILRTLEQSATQDTVRQQAAQRLATYVSPPLSSFSVGSDTPEP